MYRFNHKNLITDGWTDTRHYDDNSRWYWVSDHSEQVSE